MNAESLINIKLLTEDLQQFLFVPILIIIFIIQKYFRCNFRPLSFFLIFLIWFVLQGRFFIMREIGMYSGRILITKLNEDTEGLEARKLSAGLKLIGKTYHLPGSSLLPYNIKESDIKKWFSNGKRPSIIISGTRENLVIDLPIAELLTNYKNSLNSETNKYFSFDNKYLYFNFPTLDKILISPIPPNRIILYKESDKVLYHYLGWLSAYFNMELYEDPSIRLDTIHEASSIFGPWKTRDAISFARYLKTLDEFLDQLDTLDFTNLKRLDERLTKSLYRMENGNLKSAIFGLRNVIRSNLEENLTEK